MNYPVHCEVKDVYFEAKKSQHMPILEGSEQWVGIKDISSPLVSRNWESRDIMYIYSTSKYIF